MPATEKITHTHILLDFCLTNTFFVATIS